MPLIMSYNFDLFLYILPNFLIVTLDGCIQMIEVNVAKEDKEENTGEHLSEQRVHGAPFN